MYTWGAGQITFLSAENMLYMLPDRVLYLPVPLYFDTTVTTMLRPCTVSDEIEAIMLGKSLDIV